MIDVLQDVSTKYDCAVILTSELAQQIDSTELKPALGGAYLHRVPQRIQLSRLKNEKIIAHIQKNMFGGQALIPLRITKNGIEDDFEYNQCR